MEERMMDVIVEIYNHMDDSDKEGFTLEDAEDMVEDQIRMDKEAGREPLAYDPQFFYDSIMQFGNRVLVAQMNWNGMLEGAVYGFVEDPEEGWSPIECRLELLKISDETYTDAGHAIEWCIKNAH